MRSANRVRDESWIRARFSRDCLFVISPWFPPSARLVPAVLDDSWKAYTSQGVAFKELVAVLRSVRAEVESPATAAAGGGGGGVDTSHDGLSPSGRGGFYDAGYGGGEFEATARGDAGGGEPAESPLLRYIINPPDGERVSESVSGSVSACVLSQCADLRETLGTRELSTLCCMQHVCVLLWRQRGSR